MTQPLLSILIPTVVGREDELNGLIKKICGSTVYYNTIEDFKGMRFIYYYVPGGGDIEIVIGKDTKEITIGEKRELLYKRAKGLFSWQIDDDDSIAPNAIELILQAIKDNPTVDVISFEEYCNMDGKEYKSNHSATYSGWYGDGSHLLHDGFHFHRTPFFKDVIRTELAKSVPIPHIRFGEDNEFADSLLPLIKSEHHISEPLYRYIHISSDHETRYGFDKDNK